MHTKHLKILIADDEEGLRIAMAGILELEGHTVALASNGPEAIELVKRESFDIAFLDFRMPGINGVETFKEIKKISPETAVVMMTAFAVSDLVKEAVTEGAYACLNKPFDMERIIDTLREVSEKPFVMVVDDDPALCELLHDRLVDNGFNVVTKPSGMDGIAATARRIPDVLFLDVMMEGIDGIETLRRLKETLGDRAPKTVIMSAYDSPENFDRARALGAVACLRKPLNTAHLRDLVKKLTHEGINGKVCLVDTDPTLRDALRRALADSGYELDVAASVREVLDRIQHDSFKVVILNATDSDGTGLDVYEQIKKVDPEMGVIFISGSDSAESIAETVRRNNFMYLHKPFDPEVLINMIKSIQRGKQKK